MFIYTVTPKDSIYQIAKQFHIPMELLITTNGLSNPEELSVGQSLIISEYRQLYTVKDGDTLLQIGKKFGLSIRELFQKNPQLKGQENLVPGETLVIDYPSNPADTITITGYAYPFIKPEVLAQTLPYLTYLAVFSYRFTPSGELIEIEDSLLLQEAKKYNVAPVLVLSNLAQEGVFDSNSAHQMLIDPAAQLSLIENLLLLMKQKGYYGIDLDFEYLLQEDKDNYISFVEHLKKKMTDNGFFVTVSLVAKVSANQEGSFYEVHDYSALGKIADFASIMAYEWGYAYGPPMAIAPLNQVKKVIEYAQSVIAKEKIRLGTPNYGYNFILPFKTGGPAATSLTNTEALDLAFEREAEIYYDTVAQAPWFEYHEKEKIQHQVWFEDARSVLATMELASSYNIQGISIWNIMNYFPQLWQILIQKYKIKTHFLEN